ncbi:hypothetical protein V6N11_009423 [Hibiscus sabdariffa]|uniref:Uncharacterized protein n=1 Tax=Hibiscus sabdariffa TaxID=183260 RepID=A0ABR2NTB0_9ROSI
MDSTEMSVHQISSGKAKSGFAIDTENAKVVGAGITARVKKKPTKAAKPGSKVLLGKLLSQYSQNCQRWQTPFRKYYPRQNIDYKLICEDTFTQE